MIQNRLELLPVLSSINCTEWKANQEIHWIKKIDRSIHLCRKHWYWYTIIIRT